MEEKLLFLDPKTLHSHPLQDEIYNTTIDDKFLASIKDYGVMTPIIIMKGDILGIEGYVILSGHRRRKAAEMAEISKVPAILEDVVSADHSKLLLVSLNNQREKTQKEKAQEFNLYKQILSQVAKARYGKGIGAEDDSLSPEAKKVCETLGVKGGNLNTEAVFVDQLGYSRSDYRNMNTLFSPDHMNMHLERWYNGKKKNNGRAGLAQGGKDEKQILDTWQQARKLFTEGDYSAADVVKELKKLIANADKKYIGEPEKKKTAKKTTKKTATKNSGGIVKNKYSGTGETETTIFIHYKDPQGKACEIHFDKNPFLVQFHKNH